MQIRRATPDDYGWVFEMFHRDIRRACTHVEGMDGKQVVRLMENLIANGWTPSVVETEGRLIAFAVHRDRNHLAWVHVRDLHRGEGVCRWFLGKLGIDYREPLYGPFVPNRNPFRGLLYNKKHNPLGWRLFHRPYDVVPA